MYEAIVALPLIGALIAGVIALVGARNRFPGEDPAPPHDDDAAPPVREELSHGAPLLQARHAAASSGTHVEESEHEPPAAGAQAAGLITTTLLAISCVLSWYAFYDVGVAGHEARLPAAAAASARRLLRRGGRARGATGLRRAAPCMKPSLPCR